MSEGERWGWAPIGSPQREEEQWRHFGNSVNAVSFGFVATVILISMFLFMAIFERFLRPASPPVLSTPDLEAHLGFNRKLLGYPSPKMSVYAKGVSVLMPGEAIPTFIAHPVPVPCPPERTPWPPHQRYNSLPDSTSTPTECTNSTLSVGTSRR